MICVFSRIESISIISRLWRGPISVAVYCTDSEAARLYHVIWRDKDLLERVDIEYHVVYASPVRVFY